MNYYNLQVSSYKGLYTYCSVEDIEIGTCCIVNFRNKKELACILEKTNFNQNIKNIKEIEEILYDDKIDSKIFELIKWIKEYYISEYHLILPSIINLNYKNYDKIKKYKEEIILENEKIKIKKNKENIILNDEQNKISNEIINSDFNNFLLYGITGSGKTEIYISVIDYYIKNKKSVILLVPEIALTEQIIKRFSDKYDENIIVFHSKLTTKKRLKAFQKAKTKDFCIVIGTRSSLFLPVKNLGLIIIDEEHESTYKQEDNITYNAKSVALKRAMLENSKTLFGSATPSFESLYLASTGKFKRLDLLARYNNSSLPEYEIKEITSVDDMIDDKILEKISQKLYKDEQVIVILNRKSYSVVVECENGHKKKCPNCSINLNYLKSKNILRCTHCNYIEKYSENCLECGHKYIKKGIGTEKVEEILDKYFGEDILRMDSDTMTTDKKLKDAYEMFKNKEKKILIGTQMIAKGFHFKDVTLVIVVNSEQTLNISDFRNSEKTYQLILQASGRAGREEKKGKVVLQTFDKNSKFISQIVENDYLKFYEDQIYYRELFFLPPISKMIKITLLSKNDEKTRKESIKFYNDLNKIYNNVKNEFSSDFNISPPEKSPIHKLNKKYRYNMYIYGNKNDYNKIKKILRYLKNKEEIYESDIYIDVEPLNLI